MKSVQRGLNRMSAGTLHGLDFVQLADAAFISMISQGILGVVFWAS